MTHRGISQQQYAKYAQNDYGSLHNWFVICLDTANIQINKNKSNPVPDFSHNLNLPTFGADAAPRHLPADWSRDSRISFR